METFRKEGKMRIYRNLQAETRNGQIIPILRHKYRVHPDTLIDVNAEDAKYLTERFTTFLARYLQQSNLKGYVIGLSGGIDSSLCATLAAMAVGKDKVFGMLLPSKFTSQEHLDDALLIASSLGIETNNYKMVQGHFDDSIELTMKMTGIEKGHPGYDLLLGNNHARERMKILRGKASSLGYLVLGTTNLTESWLGYATVAGDGYKGVDIEPIQQLPKSSERIYCRHLKLPKQIIRKPPTAGLWEGQTDEGEIGMRYKNIDRLMVGLKLNIPLDEIVRINYQYGMRKEIAEKVANLARRNAFKAKPEPYADLYDQRSTYELRR